MNVDQHGICERDAGAAVGDGDSLQGESDGEEDTLGRPPTPSVSDLYAAALPEDPLPPPAYPAPRPRRRGFVRPEGNPLDSIWYLRYADEVPVLDSSRFATADSLLRRRAFAPAFVALGRLNDGGRPNDTLAVLLAYTYLELGEGREAVILLEGLEAGVLDPKVAEWWRGLGYSLMEDTAAATDIFRQLAAEDRHPRRREARKALLVVE